MGDKSLERFRIEYEKLHRALKKSHESEKRLMQKCRELNAEIVANAAKVTTALKLSQEDKATISSLKQVCLIVLTTIIISTVLKWPLHQKHLPIILLSTKYFIDAILKLIRFYSST